MRGRHLVFRLITFFLLSSCDFNINDSPGTQMSSSIKEAQSHGTFICSYKLKDANINGIPINSIFAEKQFFREDNFFLSKEINCCKSQLIIVSERPFSDGSKGYDQEWKVVGFEHTHSFMIFKKYSTIAMPDSIPLTIVAISGNDTAKIIKKLTLVKVN